MARLVRQLHRSRKHALAANLAQRFSGALEREEGEISLVFQPIVELANLTRIVGLEALIRWETAEGKISPDSFISALVSTQSTAAMTRWVFREACAAKRRINIELPSLRKAYMAVNVPASDITDPKFLAMAMQAIQDNHLNPGEITIEVTERQPLINNETARHAITTLHNAGTVFAIDDLGTEHSLHNLKACPAAGVIKLDRGLITTADPTLIASVTRFAHGRNITVVVEGIESIETARAFANLGCDSGQGFFIDRPMSLDEVVATYSEPQTHRPSHHPAGL